MKLKSFKNVMDLDFTVAIKSAVEAGLGLGFVSRWGISEELELGALKVVEVDGIRIFRHFSEAHHIYATYLAEVGPNPGRVTEVVSDCGAAAMGFFKGPTTCSGGSRANRKLAAARSS